MPPDSLHNINTLAYEFTRNGRRYTLYPPLAKPLKLRVITANEFCTFINEDPDSTKIVYLPLIDVDNNGDDIPPQKDIGRQISRKERRQLEREKEKMIKWIKMHCEGLLRPIGKPAKLEPFVIDTGDAELIKIGPRPYSPMDLTKIKEFVDEGLLNGIIHESESPWSAPIVFASKADGGTHVCVDYRALNRITKKDAYSLPCIDESFSQFHRARFFATLDPR